MRSVNKIILVGNAGRPADLAHTQSGKKVANLSIATNRPMSNGGQRTDWHRLVFWEKLAEFVTQYVTTGDRLYIEGRLEYGSYEKNGFTIPTADIVVHEVVLLTPKGAVKTEDTEDTDTEDTEDDLDL